MGLLEQHFAENSAVKLLEEGEKLNVVLFLIAGLGSKGAKGKCEDVGVAEMEVPDRAVLGLPAAPGGPEWR